MQLPTPLLVAAVTLGLSSMTQAVCSGYDLAIGTANALTTGDTTWTIYNTVCTVINTYTQSSAIGICDSQVFHCGFGTALIDQYDDPVSGWAYNGTTDTTVEACGSDIIITCGAAFWGQDPDISPLDS